MQHGDRADAGSGTGSAQLPPALPFHQQSDEIIDVYKLSVEMADRISSRRGQANQFYLALESLLLGGPAIFQSRSVGAGLDPARTTSLAAVGILVAVIWWMQLRSYRDLNRAKWSVINRIELEHLTVRPFVDEWEALKAHSDSLRHRYAELGTVERAAPGVFVALNIAWIVWVWR